MWTKQKQLHPNVHRPSVWTLRSSKEVSTRVNAHFLFKCGPRWFNHLNISFLSLVCRWFRHVFPLSCSAFIFPSLWCRNTWMISLISVRRAASAAFTRGDAAHQIRARRWSGPSARPVIVSFKHKVRWSRGALTASSRILQLHVHAFKEDDHLELSVGKVIH